MSRRLKIKQRKVRDKLINLIRKILKEHPRDTPKKDGSGYKITKRSGNLFKQVKPSFKFTDKKLVMEVRMMNYYQYLDGGTSKMDGWFFSEEIMSSKELRDITEDLMVDSIEGRLLDMVSDINKK